MMNSTVMPDKIKPEETFPDHLFASKAIESIRYFNDHKENYFMTAVGFKMPHTALHVPFKYYDMYRNRNIVWNSLDEAGRVFPPTAPTVAWRCCAAPSFRFMNQEGALRNNREEGLEDMKQPVSPQLYQEMMWGYAAAVTFVDKQLGRILDVLDELNLWNNLTVVLTADHGIHNGEKGLWFVL